MKTTEGVQQSTLSNKRKVCERDRSGKTLISHKIIEKQVSQKNMVGLPFSSETIQKRKRKRERLKKKERKKERERERPIL